MGLEVADWIDELVPANPVGGDPKSQGDDHIRMIKHAVQNQFPNLGKTAVKISAIELNGFTGMVAAFPSSALGAGGAGWLKCNGQEIVRADYPDLFAFIGEAYGPGDGATTFNLPRYTGLFLRGQDEGSFLDPSAASRLDHVDRVTVVGDVIGSFQWADTAPHDHALSDPGHIHSSSSAQDNSNDGPTTGHNSRGPTGSVNTNSAVTGITVAQNVGVQTTPVNCSVVWYIHI